MKKVGNKLQEKRRELKLTYQDVAKLTKLPIGTIKAIEKGDLDYFQNDLTYVRFYVRSYCKALHVPYEGFKDDVLDSVDEYTATMSLNVVKQHEKMEKNIAQRSEHNERVNVDLPEDKKPKLAKKDRVSISQNAQQNRRFQKKRLDFAFLSLIAVIVVIAGILIYVGVNAVMNNDSTTPKEEEVGNVTPSKPTPDKKEEPKEDENQTKPEDTSVNFKEVTPSSYAISGIKANEVMKLEVTFKNAGSFNLWKGSTSVENAYNVYQAGATYTYEGAVVAGEAFTLNFWNFGGATIKVNGKTLEYNESALQPDANGVTFFTLTTTGE